MKCKHRELGTFNRHDICALEYSAHHPHKNHIEHRDCNPGGGVCFAVLLGSGTSYATPCRF